MREIKKMIDEAKTLKALEALQEVLDYLKQEHITIGKTKLYKYEKAIKFVEEVMKKYEEGNA